MLIIKQYIIFLIGSVLLINGLVAENKSVKVDGSDNQWPMSGGPDGSYRVKTSVKVPTKWSVRNNVNIKWKTSLPEGGQSGIAVWGDKLFLTINPPLDTAPYIQSKSQFEATKKKYSEGFAAAEKQLDKGMKIKATNPYSGESEMLTPEEHKLYIEIKEAEFNEDYKTVQKGLSKFSRMNAAAYMTLLD